MKKQYGVLLAATLGLGSAAPVWADDTEKSDGTEKPMEVEEAVDEAAEPDKDDGKGT